VYQWLCPLLISAACGADRPVEVTAIQVGRSRNLDKTIAQQAFEFRPNDTIHAAVVLEGRGSNLRVKARWSMPAGLTNESEQIVSSQDRAVAPFELRSAGGFPPGRYTLEVFLNDVSAGTKELHVK
jgi:hypothetical protein